MFHLRIDQKSQLITLSDPAATTVFRQVIRCSSGTEVQQRLQDMGHVSQLEAETPRSARRSDELISLSSLEARAGVEPTYTDLQSLDNQ